MASPRFPFISPEDYLAGEHDVEEKHEYLDGEIVAMAGTLFAHVLIVSNLARILAEQLKETRYRELTPDMRVSVAERRAFCYPDIAVACFPFESMPGKTDTLTNPTILIEVLSPSTRAADRNRRVPLSRDPFVVGIPAGRTRTGCSRVWPPNARLSVGGRDDFRSHRSVRPTVDPMLYSRVADLHGS